MSHLCHWPGCGKPCPPARWGCSSCWFKLPKFLRDAVWKHYRAGQEISKDPSNKYVIVARLVQLWIEARDMRINDVPDGRGLTKLELAKVNVAFLDQMRAANL